jgi:glycosyltransferase involved in cell wall biosynthesis
MVVPSDRGGCGYFRLTWPAQAVGLARPDWTVSVYPPEKIQAGFRGKEFVGVQGFPDPLPDLLIMQRVGTPGQYNVLKWASEQGIATVVDFDDAMWCIDKDNYAWSSWNMGNTHGQHWKYCDEAAVIADLVTVTTDALARRYGRTHSRTEIIPNYVPRAAVDLPKKQNEVFTAGWAGFTQTHPGDCRVSAPAAQAVLDAGGRLCVVADAKGAAKEWDVPLDRVESIPPQKLGPDYFASLSSLDLMLVGLRETPFNRAKSTLKVLEAGAAGAFAIAPDNPPHRALMRSGYPVELARSPSDWADTAKWLASVPADERTDMSAALVELVKENWTIESNAERWAAAWQRAMNRKR